VSYLPGSALFYPELFNIACINSRAISFINTSLAMVNKDLFRCRFKGCGKLYRRNAALKRHCKTHRSARAQANCHRTFALKLPSEQRVRTKLVNNPSKYSAPEEQKVDEKSERQESDRERQEAGTRNINNGQALLNVFQQILKDVPPSADNGYHYPDFFHTRVLPQPIMSVVLTPVPQPNVWMRVQAIPAIMTRRPDAYLNTYNPQLWLYGNSQRLY